MYTAFNTATTAYDLLRVAYNTKLTEEKTRNEKLETSLFGTPVELPDRPCTPD